MFDPGLHLPFTTYRRFVDGKPVVADLAPTLIHHYESEKFRGTDEDLRLAVLDATRPHTDGPTEGHSVVDVHRLPLGPGEVAVYQHDLRRQA